MTTPSLKLQKRTQSGKGAARKLRTQGLIPGVIYGAGKAPTPITIDSHDLMMIVKEGGFYSRILSTELEGTKEQVLPRELQRDPVRGRYVHLDLLRFDPKKKITVNVPVHVIGEEDAPGIAEGGTLQVIRAEVEVLCLASKIPESIEVSIAGANIGDNVRFSDLDLPADVELTDEEDRTIASVAAMRAVEEDPVESDEEGAEGDDADDAQAEDGAAEAADGDDAPADDAS